MEKIIKFTKKLWPTNKQYGFLPGRNTMDAILQIIEDWERAKDSDVTPHAVCFDFEKAFDLVIHLILLLKLDKIMPKWMTK